MFLCNNTTNLFSAWPTLMRAEPYGVSGPNSFPASIMSAPRYSWLVSCSRFRPSLLTGTLSYSNNSARTASKRVFPVTLYIKSSHNPITWIWDDDGSSIIFYLFRVTLGHVCLLLQVLILQIILSSLSSSKLLLGELSTRVKNSAQITRLSIKYLLCSGEHSSRLVLNIHLCYILKFSKIHWNDEMCLKHALN